MIEIKYNLRNKETKLDALRAEGQIPAVYYGKKNASMPISINYIDFVKTYKKAGESTVITLTGAKELSALIHEIDLHPVTSKVRHVDFYVFDKDQKLEIGVPIEIVGISKAVKDLGGILVKVMHELKVSALPKDLPHTIKVDISTMETLHASIKAGSIVLPTGVTLISKPEDVVVSVAEVKEEKEEIVKTIDMTAIEVEKKGKEPKEGEEAAAGDAAKAAPKAKK